MYVGRRWLGYTDEQVWSLTPRQFAVQLSVHEDVTKKMYGMGKSNPQLPGVGSSGYIDQIPGW